MREKVFKIVSDTRKTRQNNFEYAKKSFGYRRMREKVVKLGLITRNIRKQIFRVTSEVVRETSG